MMGRLMPDVRFGLEEHARRVDRANREAWKYQDLREARGRGLRERVGGMLARPRRQADPAGA
jgi:hypothetical protein